MNMSVISKDFTGRAKTIHLYPSLIIKGHAKFQLKVSENKDIIFLIHGYKFLNSVHRLLGRLMDQKLREHVLSLIF